MGKIHVCPICGGTEFFTTAHVSETWRVDCEGNWIETVSSGDDIIMYPDDGEIWECVNCGAEGELVDEDDLEDEDDDDAVDEDLDDEEDDEEAEEDD